jgi:LysR family transcriptional regulator, hydrogen peroxide-inducible genes activator
MRYSCQPFTLRQLQYATAVAEFTSFRKAAEACAVSQPALSAQISQLETTLGVRLFDRDTTSVRVTTLGREFVERAQLLLEAANDLIDCVASSTNPTGAALRIGVIPTVGPYLLPQVAVQLRHSFPQNRFTWVEDKTATLIAKLKSDQLDGAIVALENADIGEAKSLILGKDPFYLALPHHHPLASAETPLLTETLLREKVLVLEDGHCLGDQVQEICRKAQAGELDVCGTSLSTLCQMVVGGLGITLIPKLACEHENRLGTLCLRAFESPPARTLVLIWRSGTPVAEALKAIAPVLRAALS